ncbi:MAG: ATP-dependent Clp protease adapter ClpS [Betaproteobacteria bacterium]|jgi:ATP-dependent Clp protease adaptor protein ClpS
MPTNPSKKPNSVSPTVKPFSEESLTSVLDREIQKTEPPKLYRVILLNDDFTPMEFVVMVIREFFHKDQETATRIMLQVHIEGKGVCGVFTKDVASTKVEQVIEISRKSGHPLQCMMEKV